MEPRGRVTDRRRRSPLHEAARRARMAAARAEETLAHRLTAFAHAGSAVFSAAACVLFMAAWIATAPAARATADAHLTSAPVLVATALDVDFDGHADLANPSNGFIRGRDHYGAGGYGAGRDGGRRRHLGVDYVAAPGGPVRAPIAGAVTLIGHAYGRSSGLDFIEIRDEARNLRARVFYVSPRVSVGQVLVAGDPIGVAQDLTVRYPAGITNHVHVELMNAQGRHIDPSTLLPLPHYEYAASGGAGPTVARR